MIGQTVEAALEIVTTGAIKGAVRVIATDYYGPENEGDTARIRAYASFDAEKLTTGIRWIKLVRDILPF